MSDADAINIYGDKRECHKCKKKADVVEKGKDYCCDCWALKYLGKSIDRVGQELLQREKQ